jgi:hypothetical protein
MLLSSILYAISFVGFKFWGEGIENIRIIYFWNYVGVSLILLSLLIHTNVRTSTLQYFKSSGVHMWMLNLGNETLSIIANALNNFIALSVGVAVVQTFSNGLQPIFSFLLVFLSSKVISHIYHRKYTKKELVWKFVLCCLTFLLLFLFYRIV